MITKTVLREKLSKKFTEMGLVSGSGAMYIPLLADLFPKLWGPKMRGVTYYYFLISGNKIQVSEELYLSVEPGEIVNISYDNKNRIIKLSA